MDIWWQSLSAVNKGFAVAALFFSITFVWQIIGMLIGLDGHSHAGADHAGIGHNDVGHGHPGHDGSDSQTNSGIAFSLVSVRSVLAFCTLFSWAGTLYLMTGASLALALLYSALWGVTAMFLVSYILYKLLRLQETGNINIWSAIGESATVYMNIPAAGAGKVRVTVSGAVSYVNARSSGGEALLSGAKVKVVGIINENTLEVEPIKE
jgi:membrane protein implicated in regulation of membrane protease activity